ncbi:diguanylate cyclase [Desulfobacula sp.]|uniref:diguanylate cyclase n=1 Tax=Desulfobacula sp. TaxID=2593537 RepID=UPI0026181053|nr:diguanylate cyclase [Desulfobacula sp.]
MHQKEKSRILIVDDQKMNLKVLADLLKDEYTTVLAISGTQAMKHALGDFPPDLILLDVIMPEMGGYEVIKMLKNNDKTNKIPVIFVTALNSIENEEHGLKLGAVDYITKPYSPPIVKIRVRNHLRTVHQYKLLDHLAYLDGLTEISNRRRFETVFQKEWMRSTRNQTPFSLAMIDVDFFKQYNDHYGHAMGDIALQKIAGSLKASLKRPQDLVARYGGEEFVMILPETDAPAAKVVAQRSLMAIVDLKIPHEISQIADYVSISIGVATRSHMDNIALPETLLQTADQNLYFAKQNGRNRIVTSI